MKRKGIVAIIDPREAGEEEKLFKEEGDTLFDFLSGLFDEVYGDPVMIPCGNFADVYRYIMNEGTVPTLVAVCAVNKEDVQSAKKFSEKYPDTKVILFPKFKLSYESNLIQVLFLQKLENIEELI